MKTSMTESDDHEQRLLILGAAQEVMSLARDNIHLKIQLFKEQHPYTYMFRSKYWDLCNAWYKCLSAGQSFDTTLKEIST